MNKVQKDIKALEEHLRLAELGPDAHFFEDVLADNVVLMGPDGEHVAKERVVQAHRSGKGPKFTRVEMRDMKVVDHGSGAAVVTCDGIFEGPQGTTTLRFTRVWVKKRGRWHIVAGSVYGRK